MLPSNGLVQSSPGEAKDLLEEIAAMPNTLARGYPEAGFRYPRILLGALVLGDPVARTIAPVRIGSHSNDSVHLLTSF